MGSWTLVSLGGYYSGCFGIQGEAEILLHSMKNISGWVGMHNKQEPLWVLVETGVLMQLQSQFNLVTKSY